MAERQEYGDAPKGLTGQGPRLDSVSRVYSFASMPKRTNANGSESRDVLHGQLVTGENVRVHQTMQAEGTQPNPAHAIAHTEIICVREGTLEFIHDGKVERAAAGDILLVAKDTLHQVRNAGPGPVAYFIVSVGGDVK